MAIEIDVLGRFAVRRHGEPVPAREFAGQLAQRLLRILVVRRGEVLTHAALVDSLWGERPPADPEANLHVLVNRARRGLGDPAAIETVPGGYTLPAGPAVTVDAEEFTARLPVARQAYQRADHRAALAAVCAALDRWRGEPLSEDMYAEWAQSPRDRWHRVRQELLELGAAASLAAGEPASALEFATEAVAGQPLREAGHLLHIRALAATGDTAAALAGYDRLRRRLADQLGIDPSREAADLHQRLLRGEPVAAAPYGSPAAAAAGFADPAGAAPFVGREPELAALAELAPPRRVGLVSGRSGSGKSRLLQEYAAGWRRPVLAARAVLPERDVPWSLARNLLRAARHSGADPAAVLPPRSRSALSDLLPELGDADERVAADPQSRRALALQGGARWLAATAPALVLVDDLQWADPSSLDLLTLVASRATEVTIVLGYRPEEIAADREVAAFLADLRTVTQPVEIELAPLPVSAVARLIADPELAELLVRATDGTPFAILEVIRGLARQDALRWDGTGWRPAVADVRDRAITEARAGQRRSILHRVDRQPAHRRQLLELLALLGRPAPARLLSEATGAGPAEQEAHLAALARAELVRPDRSGWALAHDLVGASLRDRLESAQRARLHQLLARALADDPDAAGERAHHLAGAGDRPAAAATYATAARQRLARIADREALRLAESGLGLEPADATRAALLEVRAEARFRVGELAAARADVRAALRVASGGVARSRLLARLASLAAGSEDPVRANNLVDLALAEAGADPAARARALAVGAIVDMNLERPQRAEARYAEALSLFEQVGDARGVADVLDARAMAAFLGGDIVGGIAAFDRVARLFAETGDLLRVVTPRSTRGHALVFTGAPEDGLADTEEALELARSLGNPEGEAYAQWHRSEALTACGRFAEAEQAATGALAVAQRLGHRGWTATALLALGTARQTAGDLAGGEAALRRSLATSEHLSLFACWGHARLALLLVEADRYDEAADEVEQALATGPPLGHYEARLARCALAVARAEPGAADLISAAAERASRFGHTASLSALSKLRERLP